MISETGSWADAYGGSGGDKNQIRAFFQPANTSTYIGNLETMVPRIFAGHSYWGHGSDDSLRADRKALSNLCQTLLADPIEVWNTEWCALESGTGFNVDDCSYFDLGLFMAKIIYADLELSNMSGWSFWTALAPEMWGHKDRFNLIGLYPGYDYAYVDSGHDFPITVTGSIKSQPTLWALGNYSLFVRPGYKRVKIKGDCFDNHRGESQNMTKLMATAFISPGFPVERIVVVYVNCDTRSYRVAAEFNDDLAIDVIQPRFIRSYRTDANNTGDRGGLGMRREGHVDGMIYIPARSIYTVVYDFEY